jgi:hypothetical protein
MRHTIHASMLTALFVAAAIVAQHPSHALQVTLPLPTTAFCRFLFSCEASIGGICAKTENYGQKLFAWGPVTYLVPGLKTCEYVIILERLNYGMYFV